MRTIPPLGFAHLGHDSGAPTFEAKVGLGVRHLGLGTRDMGPAFTWARSSSASSGGAGPACRVELSTNECSRVTGARLAAESSMYSLVQVMKLRIADWSGDRIVDFWPPMRKPYTTLLRRVVA